MPEAAMVDTVPVLKAGVGRAPPNIGIDFRGQMLEKPTTAKKCLSSLEPLPFLDFLVTGPPNTGQSSELVLWWNLWPNGRSG